MAVPQTQKEENDTLIQSRSDIITQETRNEMELRKLELQLNDSSSDEYSEDKEKDGSKEGQNKQDDCPSIVQEAVQLDVIKS